MRATHNAPVFITFDINPNQENYNFVTQTNLQ